MTYTRFDNSCALSMACLIKSSWKASINRHQVYYFMSKAYIIDDLSMEKINVKVTLMLSSTLIKIISFAIEIFVFTEW